MMELIQQNPVVSIVLMMVPVVGVTWKVLDFLYIKPRDFRISVLEKNVDEIRKELQKTSSTEASSGAQVDKFGSPNKDDANKCDQEKIGELVQSSTLLNDMTKFYEAWRDDCLTDLQRDYFEKNYIGQKVVWCARLASVREEKDGLLWVSLISEDEKNYSPHVIAVFESRYKEALLMINKEEKVTVSGVIHSFSLTPLIRDCSVLKRA